MSPAEVHTLYTAAIALRSHCDRASRIAIRTTRKEHQPLDAGSTAPAPSRELERGVDVELTSIMMDESTERMDASACAGMRPLAGDHERPLTRTSERTQSQRALLPSFKPLKRCVRDSACIPNSDSVSSRLPCQVVC